MTSSTPIPLSDEDSHTLFRFHVVSAVLAREALGEVRAEAVVAVAREPHLDVDNTLRRVSVRSLYRWLAAFERQGVAGLADKPRQPRPVNAVSQAMVAFWQTQRSLDPAASLPELIKRAECEGFVAVGQLKRSTVWRAFKAHGIPTRRPKAVPTPKRRFAYAHRMQMVLCDGKHFRAGRHRTKRVALFFIDDATRFVIGCIVGPSESSDLFQRGFYRCVREFGLMQRLYLDHGSAFTAQDSVALVSRLGVHLIHGTVGYPEGRGKVERFNRTIGTDLLRHFDAAHDLDPDCDSLTQRLRHYLDRVYHQRPHDGLEGLSPYDRFHSDPVPLRFPDADTMARGFVRTLRRKASSDSIVSFLDCPYELPDGYADRYVDLRYDIAAQSLSLCHEGRFMVLQPVDLYRNARRPPLLPPSQPPLPEGSLPPSSAQAAFAEDFKPLVDDQGNYPAYPEDSP